jgi:hypothetical protein
MAGILVGRRWMAGLPVPVAALGLLAASAARADGYSLRLEPGYSASKTETTADGVRTDTENTAVLQRYGLTLDKTLWPLVRFGAGGILDWSQGTLKSPTLEADTDAKRWSGYARLDVGVPTARAGALYEHREESSRFEPRDTALVSPSSARLINDSVTANGRLAPEGLPGLDLRLRRTETHDAARATTDTRQNELQAIARYIPVRPVDLRYTLRIVDAEDRISGTDALSLSNAARAGYQETLLQQRLTLYASYEVTRLDTRTTVSGAGGSVFTQQFPIRGLSAIETFPALPDRIALEQNPLLVDANLVDSAGLDIGYSRTQASDSRPRHMGLQFADALTPVNQLQVWIDRALPPDVANAYAAPGRWIAFRSDDNAVWTPVTILAVAFGVLQNRFEITIAETSARYLKVVTTPLPLGVTVDPRLASVFVTELQAFRVQSAADVVGRQSTTQGNFNSALRYQFAQVKGLSYDLATTVRHGGRNRRPAWLLTNGLGYLRQLRPTLLLTTRLDRTDSDDGRGHEAVNGYTATLGATPLRTLSASASVSGSYAQLLSGNELRNSILASATADLYRGVAVTASASATHGRTDTGRTVRTVEGSATTSLVPHRTLTMSATFIATDTRVAGGGLSDQGDSIGRAEASASFTPVQAIYLSGSVSRFLWGPQAPDLFANVGATVSPFQGAPLLLRFNYQESFDTGQELRSRVIGPGLRWTIRPRWFVDVNYTILESTSPTVETESRIFFANLLAVIG